MAELNPDICIIGAGAAGLSVAAQAAQLGASVVIVERHKMGGESLNYGCVPSKAMLAAGRAHTAMAEATAFGIRNAGPGHVDYTEIQGHVRSVIKEAGRQDSIERFTSLGCRVLFGRAQFINPRTLQVNETAIRARRFVVATGSRPSIPAIEGLKDIPFLTNENIFDLAERPRHLVIIGGGVIGAELGQAFRTLGSDVTIITQHRFLGREDKDLVGVLKERLTAQGIRLIENASVQRFAGSAENLHVNVLVDGIPETIAMTHVLVAVGRSPRMSSLHPESAGIYCSSRGIRVNKQLRTSNHRVYALGDCIGAPFFTHVCEHEAKIVVANALLGRRKRIDYSTVPSVLYTDPEIATVGLSEAAARLQHNDITVLRAEFADNDRALAERRATGLIKVMVRNNGTVVGAGIVGPHAGELLLPWQMVIENGLKLDAIAGAMVAYPTLSEISKRVAAQFYAPKTYSAWQRMLARVVQILP